MNVRSSSGSAPGGSRTPNLLVRSQTLYPLSYGRSIIKHTGVVQTPGKKCLTFPLGEALPCSA
jgi:hypothetical protein